MSKFQEVLNKQIKYAEFTENPVVCLDIEVAKGLLNTQKESPTLEECIKEWEALGYEVFTIEDYSISFFKYFENDEEEYETTFELKTKSYYCTNMYIEISVEIHQLITKTMKSLGWM